MHDYAALLRNDYTTMRAGSIRVTSLGTTTMLVDDGDTQILMDAFITSTGLTQAFLRRPVSTDTALVDRALDRVGAERVAAIFVTHSHHDHAFDLAHIALRTGAHVYGSASALNVARGGGVPESQLHTVDLDSPVTVGAFTITSIRSKHSPHPIGGAGTPITQPLTQPVDVFAYEEGGTYDYLLHHRSSRILVKSSANWEPNALDGVTADALILAVAGLGKATQDFADEFFRHTIDSVDPAVIVPSHWNDFFAPAISPLPFNRMIVDNTDTAFRRLIAHARRRDTPVAILDAYTSIDIPPNTNTTGQEPR